MRKAFAFSKRQGLGRGLEGTRDTLVVYSLCA